MRRTSTPNKERTSISIDPKLLERAKNLCSVRAAELERKYSFSELVAAALKSHCLKLERQRKKDSDTGVIENGYQPHV